MAKQTARTADSNSPAPEPNRRLAEALKQLRNRHGWTLSDVSKKTGLSISALSKVQNGQMSLTYDKLLSLSTGLGVDVTYFFTPGPQAEAAAQLDSGTQPVVTGRRSVHRHGEGHNISAPMYDHIYPASELSHKGMVPIFAELRARSLDEFGPMMRHPGEEFTVVMEGRVEVHTEFYSPITLEVGDGIYIDSTMGHAYLAAAEGVCRVLSVCTSTEAEVEGALSAGRDASPPPRVVRAEPPTE